MINKVILVGNVGKEPEVKNTTTTIANLTLATSKKVKGESKTEWHNLVFFGKLAEIVGQYVNKGSKLYVEGEIETRKWTDKEGRDRYTTSIICNQMQMLGDKQAVDSKGSNQGYPQRKAEPDFSDDIPF